MRDARRRSVQVLKSRLTLQKSIPKAEESMSNPTAPTAGWERVDDRYYRKVQLYDGVFDQDLELENYIIVGAPYGGALGTELQYMK